MINLTNSNLNDILLGSDRGTDFLLPKPKAQSRSERLNRFSIADRNVPFSLEEIMPFQKGHPQFNSGKTHFKKGIIPWNKGTKGVCKAWNKGLHPDYVQGKNHPMWKGGEIIIHKYVFIWEPNHPFCNNMGYVRKHRLEMEKHLGRYLDPKEIVHHIDGNPLNNDIKNLKLYSNNGKHMSDYYKLKRR